MNQQVKVLFVCMGNICRSPTAHGVFRHLVKTEGLETVVKIDSAGTHAYHVGETPDQRSQQAALQRGVEMSDLRARKVTVQDFELFDYVIAMDRDNFVILDQLCPAVQKSRLRMFMEFAPDFGALEVPDPYYGGPRGFEQVLDQIEEASNGLLEEIRRLHLS